jgi:biotin---protein ligase
MNVLVYSGPEALQTSVSRTITSLRSALYPQYTVQPLSLQSLSSHPWMASCALLVIPACQDHLAFTAAIAASIRSYVQNGGAFLGLRAGVKYGGSLLGTGDYSLRFQSAAGPSIHCSFLPGPEHHSRRIAIVAPDGNVVPGIVESSATIFDGVDGKEAVTVLARNAEDSTIVANQFDVGTGKLALWGPSIEVPIVNEEGALSPPEARLAEERRRELLDKTLVSLGLQLPSSSGSEPSHPLPQFLVSSPSRPDTVSVILNSLSIRPEFIFRDTNDTFDFHDASEAEALLQQARLATQTNDTRHIILYENGTLPQTVLTPLFNIQQYFEDLRAARDKTKLSGAEQWGIGEALIYGEAVTSTQTLFDKWVYLFLPSAPLAHVCF